MKFSGKMNRKLDMILHTFQSINKTGNNNVSQQTAFLQMHTKEEFKEFEKSLIDDTNKREQFVSINYLFHITANSALNRLCHKHFYWKYFYRIGTEWIQYMSYRAML